MGYKTVLNYLDPSILLFPLLSALWNSYIEQLAGIMVACRIAVTCCLSGFLKKNVYLLFLRKRASEGGAERGDRGSQAVSVLTAKSLM